MIREVYHFLRYVPDTIAKSTRMSHAELFDLLMDRSEEAGFARWRARLVEGIRGRVLEIGCGTGRLFRHYMGDVKVVALEPALDFLRTARGEAEQATVPMALLAASAEQLPFPSDHFDAVILCDVLCSVRDPARSLDEMRRVLKPGGELRITTHVISDRLVPRSLMHLFNPLWRAYNRVGCNMNRDTEHDLRQAGYELTTVEAYQIFTPGLPAFPGRFIRAVPAP